MVNTARPVPLAGWQTTDDRSRDLLVRAAAHILAGAPAPAHDLLDQAATLDPLNTDVVLGIAFTSVLQSDLAGAMHRYGQILRHHPKHPTALLMRATYAQLSQQFGQSLLDWNNLTRAHPAFARRWSATLARAQSRIRMVLTDEVSEESADSHAFVVLGYLLNADGSIPDELRARLELALRAANRNPGSPIILSGGAGRNRRPESHVMRDWLIDQGIPKTRLLVEDQSWDTIENVLFTLRLARSHSLTALTVISSAHHSRRAAAIFDAGNHILTISDEWRIRTFAYLSVGHAADGTTTSPTLTEKIAVYRDVFRINGLWAVPGHQR